MARRSATLPLLALSVTAFLATSCDDSGSELNRLAQPAASEEALWLAPGRTPEAAGFGLTSHSADVAKQPRPPILGLAANQVCQSVTFRNTEGKTITGQQACALTPCAAGASTDCQTTAAYRSVDFAYIKAHRGGFYPAQTIAGVQGSFAATSLPGCQQTGDQNCLSTYTLRAVSTKLVHPGVIKKGETLGSTKFKGEFPSAKYPPTEVPAGSTALTTKNFAEALRSKNPYHFWTAAGELVTIKGDERLHEKNIKKDYTVYGVKGEGAATAGTICNAAGKRSCVVAKSTPWRSLNPSDLDKRWLKRDVVINGVKGVYPSAEAPLENSRSQVADLAISHSSWAQLKTNDEFEYFDPQGHRYTVMGTTNLTAANLAKGKTILGVTGNFNGLDPDAIDPADLRAGLAIGEAKQGRLNLTSGCEDAEDCFKTKQLWNRVDASGALTAAPCPASEPLCVMHNTAQRQDWFFDTKKDAQPWQDAASFCENLTHGKASDWRMPTQKELMQATVNGLGAIGLFERYSQPKADLKFWTTTMHTGSELIVYQPEYGLFTSSNADDAAATTCVRSR